MMMPDLMHVLWYLSATALLGTGSPQSFISESMLRKMLKRGALIHQEDMNRPISEHGVALLVVLC